MNIGIDGHAAERDGSGNCTYIRTTLQALKDLESEHLFFIYVTDRKHPFYRNFRDDERFVIRQLPVSHPLIRIPVFLAWSSFKDDLDILHVQYVAPPVHKGSLIAAIHDLGFLNLPESFSPLEVFRSKWLVSRTAHKASRIITGSGYSQRDIVEKYGIDTDKIMVIPYGISPAFKPGTKDSELKRIKEKYGIDGDYLLSVGRLNPRKNFSTLVQAFTHLKARKKIDLKLVIVGKRDYKTGDIIRSLDTRSSRDIVLTGFVPDDELPVLYAGAEIFVYPSLFEGVGLPILEAMRSGTPVISSNATCLRETVGEAGILVDPLSMTQIAEAVHLLLSDPEKRKGLIEAGFERVKGFTPEAAARQTLKIYEGLM